MIEGLRRRLVRERRIYIMPTGRGVTFLALIVVQILTAATYNNNLIFILAFFLFALFVVSMLQTHDNLRDVDLDFAGARGAFAGDPVTLAFTLSHRRGRDARGLTVRLRKAALVTRTEAHVDLPAVDPAVSASVVARAARRGVFDLGDVILETRHPHGLFRAWIVNRPPGEVVIYPKPAGAQSLVPVARAGYDGGMAGHQTSPEGDFGELRPHRAGDSYTQVAWKHFARTGDLYQKSHWGAARPHYVIPWLGEDEAALRQVSRWINDALGAGASFEIPQAQLGPDAGEDFAHRCWRTLARAGGS